MLKSRPVFTTLPVTDPARARRFYAEKLGLTPTEPDGDFYECGEGTRFVISKMGSKPGGHTQMVFAVDDIARTLRDRKVASIERAGADVIATGNIGCMTHIAQGTDVPIVHTVELLDWAYGGSAPEALKGVHLDLNDSQRIAVAI